MSKSKDNHSDLWQKLDSVEQQIHSSQLDVVSRLTSMEIRVGSLEKGMKSEFGRSLLKK